MEKDSDAFLQWSLNKLSPQELKIAHPKLARLNETKIIPVFQIDLRDASICLTLRCTARLHTKWMHNILFYIFKFKVTLHIATTISKGGLLSPSQLLLVSVDAPLTDS